jgi:predicted amidohydrolase YtcJ
MNARWPLTTRQIWHAAATEGIAGGSLDGAGQGGATPTGEIYTPAERISTEAALAAYTRGSAFAAFSDQRVGTLEPGKEADLVLLSQDCSPCRTSRSRPRACA